MIDRETRLIAANAVAQIAGATSESRFYLTLAAARDDSDLAIGQTFVSTDDDAEGPHSGIKWIYSKTGAGLFWNAERQWAAGSDFGYPDDPEGLPVSTATQAALDGKADAAVTEAALTAVEDGIDAIATDIDGITARLDNGDGNTPYATWAILSAIAPLANGQPAAVLPGDGGTHTDPVVGGTVANAGVYSGSLSPLGWKRVGAGTANATQIAYGGTTVAAALSNADLQALHSLRAGSLFMADTADGILPPYEINADGNVLVEREDPQKTAALLNQLRAGSVFTADTEDGVPPPLEIAMEGYALVERKALSGGGSGRPEVQTGDGQSTEEAQTEGTAAIIFGDTNFKSRPRMPLTAANNIWLGLTTAGGASEELASGAISGLTDLRDTLDGSDYGTTPLSAAVRAYTDHVFATDGYVPDIIAWVQAEGGQTIANMLNDAGAGFHYFDNYVTAITDVAAFAPGAEHTWSHMSQGQSDSADAALGTKHNLLRAQMDAVAQATLGQTIPLKMNSLQQSSFFTNSSGARSILTEALADTDGVFFCTGPTYIYGWVSPYLHHSSVGYADTGHMRAWLMDEVKRGRGWKPLHAVSATITGANTIRVVLSEPAVIDTGWMVNTSGLANNGVTLTGATITSMVQSGVNLDINTSDAASGATAVGIATVGHTSPTRAANTIPRSTIRSVAQFGTFPSGSPCHKPVCHQTIAVGA